jgi:hypothetical protein
MARAEQSEFRDQSVRSMARTNVQLLQAVIATGRSKQRARRRRSVLTALVSGLATVVGLGVAATVLVPVDPGRQGLQPSLTTTQRDEAIGQSVRRGLGVSIPAHLTETPVDGAASAVPPTISADLRDHHEPWVALLDAGIMTAERSGAIPGPTAVVGLDDLQQTQLVVGHATLTIQTARGQVGDAAHRVWTVMLTLFDTGGGDLMLVGPCRPTAGSPAVGDIEQTCPTVEVEFSRVVAVGSGSVATFESHRTAGWIAINDKPS